jgi:hypothetical protein
MRRGAPCAPWHVAAQAMAGQALSEPVRPGPPLPCHQERASPRRLYLVTERAVLYVLCNVYRIFRRRALFRASGVSLL